MNFSLNKEKQTTSKTSDGKVYVPAGIGEYKVVEFRDATELEIAKTKNRTPYILMELEDAQTGARHSERFYMTPSSRKYSEMKMTHILGVISPDSNLKSITSTDDMAYSIIGKSARFKICGKEVLGKNGKIYIKATQFPIPRIHEGKLFGFCENLNTNPSRLTFDVNNKYDVIPLEPSTEKTTEKVTLPSVDKDDLPF